jgi:diadenosine tetraphosphate (Ap4A) HIT family hydrolase
MSNVIQQRVELARRGDNPYVITKVESGWVVMGDVQPLEGYCLLLADPVVSSLNELTEAKRMIYCRDMIRIGDALMKIKGSFRINYETWGNLDPALHTHVTPRYLSEPDDKRTSPARTVYDWTTARKFDPVADKPFMQAMKRELDLQR